MNLPPRVQSDNTRFSMLFGYQRELGDISGIVIGHVCLQLICTVQGPQTIKARARIPGN